MIKFRNDKLNKAITKKSGDKPKIYNRIKTADLKADVLVEHVKPMATHDAYSNVMARLGSNTDNILNYSEYTQERITNYYPLLQSLYRENWVIRNIISAVPNDITRKWFKVKTAVDTAIDDKVERLYRKTNLINEVNRGMQWGRLFGGAIGILLVRGQEDNLDEPLSLDAVEPDGFYGIYVIDRWAGVNPSLEIIDDISDPDFGLPKYYDVSDPNINLHVRVHHTKVLRFIGRELSNVERIRELYWGVSEVESLYRDLVRRDATAENISSLVFKANLSVVKMKDLDQMFTINSVAVQDRFWNLMANVSAVESNLGVKVVNSEDSAEYLNYSFTGLKEVYETMMMDLAGASRIPVTKLFGRSPAGMNSTGESDMQNYYEFLEDVREGQFKRIVLRLLPLIALSCIGQVPDDLDFEFGSFKEMDDLQKAQILQQRSGVVLEAFNGNLIPQNVAMQELKNLSEQYGVFDGITDEMIKEGEGKFASDLQQMQDPMAGMGGDMDGMEAMMSGQPMGAGADVSNPEPPNPEPKDPSAQHDAIDDEPDELEKQLLEIRYNLLQKRNEGYYTADDLDFYHGDDVTLDDLFIQYEQLSKMKKKAEKDYQEAMSYMYSFSSMDDIPLDKVNKYNIFKNKYNNISQHLKGIEDKIKAQGGAGRLMKVSGRWDDILAEVEKERDDLKKQVEGLLQSTQQAMVNKQAQVNSAIMGGQL